VATFEYRKPLRRLSTFAHHGNSSCKALAATITPV
jgi:hypothetical protein